MYLSHYSSGVLLQPLSCFAPTTDHHHPPTLLPRTICGLVRLMSSRTKCAKAFSSISINRNEETKTSKLIYIVNPPIREGQPECITRGHAIANALKKMHFTAKFQRYKIIQIQNFKTASREEIAAVHDIGSILEETARMEEKRGTISSDGIRSLYATSLRLDGPLVNAGAGLSLVDYAVASSEVNKNPLVGFALTRPIGNKVLPEMGRRGCMFCNIAIAARYAQKVHGLRRVFIIDFDVYHGTGTCETFYDDPDVFYLSTHHDQTFSVKTNINDIGCGNGEGATLNMPLPEGSGDIAMRTVFDQVIVPCAQRFKPDIILVSAGYNGHVLDPLRKFQFTTGTYYMLASGIKQLAEDLCGGRCVFFLEGGSNVEALSNSLAESFRALIGYSSRAAELDDLGLLHDEPSFKVKQAIQKVKHLHSL